MTDLGLVISLLPCFVSVGEESLGQLSETPAIFPKKHQGKHNFKLTFHIIEWENGSNSPGHGHVALHPFSQHQHGMEWIKR